MNGSSSLKLNSGRELLYADASTVQRNIAEKGFANAPGVAGLITTDLQAGVYEGGLKIWECSVDLCNYLEEQEKMGGMKVLEVSLGD